MRTAGATRGPGRPARLSRDQVLRAALALADAEGLDGLTMRRVGAKVGAESMSLYRHVRDKEDLLDGLVDLVFAEIEIPPSGAGWRAAMRRRAISAREVLSRHPWAVGLMESRSRPGPANLKHHDGVVGILLYAGFSSATATHAYNLLDSYIFGFVLQEKSLPFASPDELAAFGEAMLRELPAEEYPNLRAVAEDLIAARFDYRKEFEVGLDLILDALERYVGDGPSPRGAGRPAPAPRPARR